MSGRAGERESRGAGESKRGGHALRRNAAAPREHVQRDALPEEDVPRLAADGRDVLDRLERLALPQVPFDPAQRITAMNQPTIPHPALILIEFALRP